MAKTGRKIKSKLLNTGLEDDKACSTETGANNDLAGAIG
jgi:hypothetical protein